MLLEQCSCMAIHLGPYVAMGLKQPTRTSLAGSPVLIKQLCPYMVLLRMGFTLPTLLPTPQVRSYRTVSPLLTMTVFDKSPVSLSGLLSVALSLRFPSLAVNQHPDPVKPGLSSRRIYAQQPSSLLIYEREIKTNQGEKSRFRMYLRPRLGKHSLAQS